jgi:anti-anti-sigma factor
MQHPGHPTSTRTPPVVVPLPDEIDATNAQRTGDQLRAAFSPSSAVVIAGGSLTMFCDSCGARELMAVHKQAAASLSELRVVCQSRTMQRVLTLLGYDRVLQIYPSLDAARMGLPRPIPWRTLPTA